MTRGQIARKFLKVSGLVHWYGRPFTYGWKRGTEYLYVGYSQNLYGRISGHSVIDVVEPFLDTDVLEVWEFSTKEEAKAHEHKLIDQHLPKYNYKAVRHRLPEVTPFGREYFRLLNLGLSPAGFLDANKSFNLKEQSK